ncbi:hypothetical protein [Erythrobacter cryptus]|uniref:hypothetical protein n=1 Tax=Erythrobacter cryptus TaxID=196588 RepID=UPI0003FC075B|nr:hypothetical protein [Erythrobacter cryptus]
MSDPTTLRIVIPLAIRKRNGRPKILPPADRAPDMGGVDPHALKAIARAWRWRRQLESGAASTIQDIAAAEKLSDRYVGRLVRLAFLAPQVLERLIIHRMPPALSLAELIALAGPPWTEQIETVAG